ncbi:hypothetical protein QFZ21_003080 [Microbacterium sp. W4I20]|nr:hypothetical protein [Microbacterium sp. W4I20]
MEPTGTDVAGLIARSSPAVRRRDAETLTALMQEVSGREPATWGTIVGFGSCHYRYPTGTEGDTGLLAFAPRKASTTIYLLDGTDAHAEALAQLGHAHDGRQLPLHQGPRTGRPRGAARHPAALARLGRVRWQPHRRTHRHRLTHPCPSTPPSSRPFSRRTGPCGRSQGAGSTTGGPVDRRGGRQDVSAARRRKYGCQRRRDRDARGRRSARPRRSGSSARCSSCHARRTPGSSGSHPGRRRPRSGRR